MWWCTFSRQKPGGITISNGYGAKGNRSRFRRSPPQGNRGHPKRRPPKTLLPSEDIPVLHRESERPARECAGGRLRQTHQPLLHHHDGGDSPGAGRSLGKACGGKENSARSSRKNARFPPVLTAGGGGGNARKRSGLRHRRPRRSAGGMAKPRRPAALALGDDNAARAGARRPGGADLPRVRDSEGTPLRSLKHIEDAIVIV